MRKETRIMKVEEMVPQIVDRPVDVWITDDGMEFTSEASASGHEVTLNQAKYKQLWEEKWGVNKLEVPFSEDELYLVAFENEDDFLEFENAVPNKVYCFECVCPKKFPCNRVFYISNSGWSDFAYDATFSEHEDHMQDIILKLREAADKLESFFNESDSKEDEWTCPICGGALNYEGASYDNHGRIYSNWICTKCGRTGTAVCEETIEVNFIEHEVNKEESDESYR